MLELLIIELLKDIDQMLVHRLLPGKAECDLAESKNLENAAVKQTRLHNTGSLKNEERIVI